jgi:hypothetical protein
MTDDMVYRVAQALRHAESYDASFIDMARAAIAAMCEPTEEMVKVGSFYRIYSADEVWRRMIYAALKGES